MSKITPFVWCESNAAELADFYLSIFPDSKQTEQNPIVTTIEIRGQTMGFINGGVHAKPNPSISFSLWIKEKDLCDTIRSKLSDGGQVMMDYQAYERSPAYGRCNDKFGVSRQVMRDNRAETTTHAMIPSLMFVGENNGKTKEAMDFYCTIFPDSGIDFTRPYGENEAGENPEHLNHAEFKLAGQQFIAMDSGMEHAFQFDDGVSLLVECDGQEEVDYYREKLTADGGSEVQCGRCKDKYGVSRQVNPVQLQQAVFHSDKTTADYAMQAMLKMKKIVIADLKK
jgi:predicted 3-demethylubiquinone-9 3-methyltransferase (glyoxalase superfamily)